MSTAIEQPADRDTTSKKGSSVPPWLRGVQFFGVLLFVAILPWAVLKTIGTVEGADQWLFFFIGGVMGYASADLLSGLVHWASDTFGSEDIPIVGCTFIAPFRRHHEDPKGLLRENVFELNGVNCLLSALLLLVGIHLSLAVAAAAFAAAALGFLLALSLGIPLASQIHQWIHRAEAPYVVRVLQSWGLIIESEAHDQHHFGSQLDDYCIVSGWWNAPMKHGQVYRRLEQIVVRLFRCPITRGSEFSQEHEPAASRASPGSSTSWDSIDSLTFDRPTECSTHGSSPGAGGPNQSPVTHRDHFFSDFRS